MNHVKYLNYLFMFVLFFIPISFALATDNLNNPVGYGINSNRDLVSVKFTNAKVNKHTRHCLDPLAQAYLDLSSAKKYFQGQLRHSHSSVESTLFLIGDHAERILTTHWDAFEPSAAIESAAAMWTAGKSEQSTRRMMEGIERIERGLSDRFKDNSIARLTTEANSIAAAMMSGGLRMGGIVFMRPMETAAANFNFCVLRTRGELPN